MFAGGIAKSFTDPDAAEKRFHLKNLFYPPPIRAT
jgi:hypothetical protein